MACGSVFASEPGLAGRDLTSGADLVPDLTPPLSRSSYRPNGEVHEAVRFLQAEHEAVLRGVHHQMALLQQRCEELEFELHLRPLTVDESAWRRRLAEATRRADEGAARVVQLEKQVTTAEEQLEQHRWTEATLRQQVEAGEQRTADLRAEVTKLRAQVRDLRVYSSALRTVGGGRTPTPRSATRTLRPPSRASLGSQESLEGGGGGGPRSLGSEDGEATGWWREARLGGSGARGPRGGAGPTPRTHTTSLPPSLPSPPPSLPPLASLPPARPSSGAVVLPPIEAGRGGAARHVRRQIRLTSAPAPAPAAGPRLASVPQREPT